MNKVVAGIVLVIVIGAVLFSYFFIFNTNNDEVKDTQTESFEGGKVSISIASPEDTTGGENAETRTG
jgi:hypothetical protein